MVNVMVILLLLIISYILVLLIFYIVCDICIRVTSVRIIIITHSVRALFDLNARVEAQGGIVPEAVSEWGH